MKSYNIPSVSIVAGMLVACAAGPLEYQTASSPLAPGADATITADVQKTQNQTNLTLEVANLPPANRVDATSDHYVVWYRHDAGETWKRIASLAYQASAREATLHTAVPETSFVLWVTTEKEMNAVSPSRFVVFEQRVGD